MVFDLSHQELQRIITLINESGGIIVVNLPSRATRIVNANLDAAVAPVLEKYREHVYTLHPGESRDIYPWRTPEHLVMEAARRLHNEGWRVEKLPYEGSVVNYSGGDYYIRVTAPGANEGSLCSRTIKALRMLIGCLKF